MKPMTNPQYMNHIDRLLRNPIPTKFNMYDSRVNPYPEIRFEALGERRSLLLPPAKLE